MFGPHLERSAGWSWSRFCPGSTKREKGKEETVVTSPEIKMFLSEKRDELLDSMIRYGIFHLMSHNLRHDMGINERSELC